MMHTIEMDMHINLLYLRVISKGWYRKSAVRFHKPCAAEQQRAHQERLHRLS